VGAFVPLLVALEPVCARVRAVAVRARVRLRVRLLPDRHALDRAALERRDHGAVLKYPAWIAAAAYLALYTGLATWTAGTLTRRARVPLAASFPFAFLAVEELRAAGELGFPWFQPVTPSTPTRRSFRWPRSAA